MSTLEHLTVSTATTNELSNVSIPNRLQVSCYYLSRRANPLTRGEPIRMLEVNAETPADTYAVQTVAAEKSEVQTEIIKLIRAWSQQPKERWADLRSRARTPAAHELIARIRSDLEKLEEQKATGRVRKRRELSAAKFSGAIERFVGDLLRAKSGTMAPALVFRSIGKSNFDHDPVKYETFTKVLKGLRELDLVSHRVGQTRIRRMEFDPGEVFSVALLGHASRFWATGRLLRLAEHCGIDSSNIGEHFAPEPPMYPLVLKDYAVGKGANKKRARRVKFKHTEETKRLEKDIRDLNEFLAGFKLQGGGHEGYIRVFNNYSWEAGGRLYSPGEHSYQQMEDTERHKMTINGEPVVEIDIKASQLTIYHAMIGEPLEGSSDPYARAGLDRWIAKKWIVITFGNGAPAMKWPDEAVGDYMKDYPGKNLRKVAKARDVARKMLETFPTLKKLDYNSTLWADLQFLEAQAVIGTMLILMRTHGVLSLSMHDGIIVPRSKADLAQGTLKREFRRVVGVEPMLTVEPKRQHLDATDL
jgi:hypothetical protein